MAKLSKSIQFVLDTLGVTDLSVVTKQMIEEKLAELAEYNPLVEAMLTASILETTDNALRRIKMALGMEVDKLDLTADNVPYLEDNEIKEQFIAMEKVARAQFVMALGKAKKADSDRVMAVLGTIKSDVIASKEAQAATQAKAQQEAEAQAEAARVQRLNADREAEQKQFDEHPEVLIRAGKQLTVERALTFIHAQPWGMLTTSAELEDLIHRDGEQLFLISMYTGQPVILEDSVIINRCFVCHRDDGNVIVRRTSGDIRWYSFVRNLEVVKKFEAEQREYEEKAVARFAAVTSSVECARVYIKVLAEIESSDAIGPAKFVQRGNVKRISLARRKVVGDLFYNEVRGLKFADLGILTARIANLESEQRAAVEEKEDKAVINAYEWLLGICSTHLGYLRGQAQTLRIVPVQAQHEANPYGNPPLEQKPAGRGGSELASAKKLLTARGVKFSGLEDKAIIALAKEEREDKKGGKGKKGDDDEQPRRARRK